MATNPNINAYESGRKSVGISYLLCFFLGLLGLHRFYTKAGNTGWWMLALHLGGWLLAGIAFWGFSQVSTESYEDAFGVFNATSYNLSTTGGVIVAIGKAMRGIAWVWWLIDLFLVPGLVRRYNSRLSARLGLGPLA